jgi:hypothetical protein
MNVVWREIWNDDETIGRNGSHDRYYCPKCHGFNLFIDEQDIRILYKQLPSLEFSFNGGKSDRADRMKCECGWEGNSLDLLNKHEYKCMKRTKLIDEMTNDK